MSDSAPWKWRFDSVLSLRPFQLNNEDYKPLASDGTDGLRDGGGAGNP